MTNRMFLNGTALVVMAGVVVPSFASAQEGDPTSRVQLARAANNTANMFGRDRNVSVSERARPGYEAIGARAGAFQFFPKIEVQVGTSDNIYASDADKQSDTYYRIRPELSVSSTWSRHALNAFGRGSLQRYVDNGSEDADTYAAGANGRIDIGGQTSIAPSASFSHLVEPRTAANSPFSAVEPVQFDLSQASISFDHISNRVKLSLVGDATKLDYDDGTNNTGGVVEQDQRDRSLYSLTARTDYAVSPDTAVFVQVSGNERDYRLSSTSTYAARDSKGFETYVGAEFDLGLLFRGEIAAGFIKQSFDDARYNDVDGASARARVEYFPSQLVTVAFTASRSIEDSAAVGSAGFLSTDAQLAVDYEFRRNVILHADVSYGQDDFKGIDRTDDRWTVGANALYLINRRLGASLGVKHSERGSSGLLANEDYSANAVTLSLVTQF
jgi:hypothetical protein